MIAFRGLIAYDRDTRGWAIPADGTKEYALVLDWLKQRGAMAKAEADFRAFRFAQDRELFRRKAHQRLEVGRVPTRSTTRPAPTSP